MNRELLGLGGLLLGAAGVIAAVCYGEHRWTQNRRKEIHTVHTGAFSHIKYEVEHETNYVPGIYYGGYPRGGTQYGPGHKQNILNDVSVVHMEDGSSVILEGKIDVLFAKGTQIVVKENGLGTRWIEKN